MNHPVLNLGYLIEAMASDLFTGDRESKFYEPGTRDYDEYQEIIDIRSASIEYSIKEADLIITDSMYTRNIPARSLGPWLFQSCIERDRID